VAVANGYYWYSFMEESGTAWRAVLAQGFFPGQWTASYPIFEAANPDRPHLAVNEGTGVPYVAFMDGNYQIGYKVFVSRLIEGIGMTTPFQVASNAFVSCFGANVAIGLNGEVYVAWGVSNINPPDPEIGIGFARLFDDDGTFFIQSRYDTIPGLGVDGLTRWPLKGFLSANSSPVMAVNRSPNWYPGSIYLVWADFEVDTISLGPPLKLDTTPDILLTKSRDRGVTWYPPVKVNSDGVGTDQWMPWVTVDPNGYVHVVFYDSRVDLDSNLMTAVYVASSYNGGQTFVDTNNVLVSSVAFYPYCVPGARSNDYGCYMGDYIGIASKDGFVYPCWNDNRTGYQKAYVAEVPRYRPPGGGGGGGGCPYVYAWDGAQYHQENTVLTACETRESRAAVTDYLKLSHQLADDDGFYRLQIREFEHEVSYLDAFELLSVDHPSDTRVGVTPGGDVFLFDQEFRPVAAFDHSGSDVLNLVSVKDGRKYLSSQPGVMDVYFEVEQGGLPGVLFDPVVPGEEAMGPPPPQKKGNPGAGVQVEVEDAHGQWHSIDELPPRALSEDAVWFLRSSEGFSSPRLRIRIRWGERFEVDQLAYFTIHESAPVVCSARLGSAKHSSVGDVSDNLALSDEIIATLNPGESIDLEFPCSAFGATTPGWSRRFILKSVGYYEQANATTPKAFALRQNNPNPFNAGTDISFVLSRRERVQLDIFNILGQRLVTLLEDEIGPGEFTVPWDGRGSTGEELPSGVYLYRLSRASGIETKKMSLVR
jgi:hypothetical protein